MLVWHFDKCMFTVAEEIFWQMSRQPIEVKESQVRAELLFSNYRPSLPTFQRVSRKQFSLKVGKLTKL